MKIMIVGKGGREHALAQALHDSPSKPEIYVHPGSDGMAKLVNRVEAPTLEALIDFMQAEKIELCVAGEESYLDKGFMDMCREAGIPAWGPVQASAQLESSKIFAKEFMVRNKVPTGDYTIVENADELREASQELPVVLKYNGLAAGKGVAVCFDQRQVEDFIQQVFVLEQFGSDQVFVEECLIGKEVSVICAVADGDYLMFTPARDYKRQLNNDQGPNTGGMGAVASRALLPPDVMADIDQNVIRPAVEGLVKDGMDYRGFLYFGIIMTIDGPKMLEFNCRFGDPEAQAVLPLVGGDFAEFLYQGAQGKLDPSLLEFDEGWSVCLVKASGDYPYSSGRGEVITGFEDINDARVYHAGTMKDDEGNFVTNGGRILAVVCKGATRDDAVWRVYEEIDKINFAGNQNRTDIGHLHFED